MIVTGEWALGDDGTARSILDLSVPGDSGLPVAVRVLLDTGADHSVFSEAILRELKLPTTAPSGDYALVGVGGASPFVLVEATLELPLAGGGRAVRFHGKFAAFTDPSALDLSVLGRDVLNHFDVILGRNRGAIMLLGGVHRFQVLNDGRS